ncbi:N-6 DNA methylase [Micromonospora sp. NBC_00898]|uniref:N-6 DNA methylase n=1 Tax=Micromonospora sp. NBC_00898 TaxID=2975981 RepID=UPI00386D7299|nr:N-6 DNA methylase [Micromonospora sp. NBC_00898]
MTLAQIAKFAQVRRPSVSNWRRRHPDFPGPVDGSPVRPLFDADEVARWLDQRPVPARSEGDGLAVTTYGDIFRASMLRGGSMDGSQLDPDRFADVALELIALRAAHQRPLPTDLSTLADLCVKAEAAHPDLVGLLSHVRAHDQVALSILVDVERLVAELGAVGAAEELLAAAGRRGWSGGPVETPAEICDLVVRLTNEMLGDPTELAVADLAAGPGRLLTTMLAAGRPRDIRCAEVDPVMAKWLRLRLFCHGHDTVAFHADGQETADFSGSDIIFVDPPFQPGEQDHHEEHPLSWASRVVECLSDEGLGFAVVPEWTLTRTATSRRLPVTWVREQLVRRGCVRAIIQLPRSIHRFITGTDLVLLVLAPDEGETSRDVVVCDANQIRARSGGSWIEQTVRLVCGTRNSREAEPCSAIPVSKLVGRRSLLPSHLLAPEAAPEDHVVGAVRARESAAATFKTDADDAITTLERIAVITRPQGVAYRTIGELLRGRQLIRLPGHRISGTNLGRSGQRVLGCEELLGELPVGERRIDVLTLGQYAAAAITEPGDVVIMAGNQLRAMVDEIGGSVLLTPVQGLRIPGYVKHSSLYQDEPQQAWIGPHALAALLGAARNAARTGPRVRSVTLQQLEIPVLTAAEYGHLDQASMMLNELAEEARNQAAALDLVRRRIAAGVADGAMSLRFKPNMSNMNT